MSPLNLLMLSGDSSVAQAGDEGAFNTMLRRFSTYWERIDILCPRAPGTAERQRFGNVYVHPSPYHRALQPIYIWRKGRELLAQRPYALIVSHDFGLFYNGIGALLLNRPYVSEIHHVEGYPCAVTAREQLSRRAAQLYISVARRRAAAFRAVNPVEIPDLLRKWDVPDDKILVLPSLYIDFTCFHPMDVPGRFDVAFVGRFAPNKGLFTLIEAVAQVKMTHPTIRIGLLGRGTLEAALRERIAALGLREQVTLITQRVPTDAVARFYNQSGMLVCASTSEGGPRVTVEAMACGVPVISTRVGIMPELIRDGENGLLFDGSAEQLALRIRRLLDDEALRETIGNAGRAAVQGFTADTVIAGYAEGYQALIRRMTHA